ncbi:P-loop containing nucleoside triphosphate hydrolase protein [Aspergillus recurvatus]
MATASKNYLRNLCSTPLLNFTTRKHVPTLVVATISCFVASFTVPLFSIILGDIFNEYTYFGTEKTISEVFVQRVMKLCIQLLALGALAWFFNGLYFVLFVAFGELQAASARSRLFERLLEKDQRFFEEQKEGTRTFLGCLQIQIQELQTATSHSLALFLQYIFRIFVCLGLAFYTSWNLTLVILAGIPIAMLVVPFLAPKINACIESQQQELKATSKVVNSSIVSIDAVKCLNVQEIEREKYGRGLDKATSHYLRLAKLTAIQISAMRFMMFAMFVQGFWYGSHLVLSGKLKPGDVVRAFWSCSTVGQAIESMMPHLLILEKGKVAATALKRTMYGGKDATSSKEVEGGLYPKHCDGEIEVKNLSFSYPSQPDRLSLDSSSFAFPAGATTFVIGKSGSGKSTLGQLLTRLYLPTSGEILIDGHPIQTLGVSWIRNNITYVEQRGVLFNESIFKNIAFGGRDHEDIRKVDVEKATKLAMLTSALEMLPNGIDTFVGEGGNTLSGGQKQRVVIARARLRNSPVLILDETISALDAANRVQVMSAIRKWREGKTTIIITHDMSHIKDSDFVYVMDQGSVVKAGYKRELKRDSSLGGFFREVEDEADDPVAESDGELTDITSSATESFKLLGPPEAYVKKSSGEYTLSSNLCGNGDDISLHKNPFVIHSEIELADLSTIGEKTRFEASSKTARFRRQLKHQRRKLQPKANTPPIKSPIRRALRSVIPSLCLKQRLLLFVAFLCVLAHASTTPIFSYLLSRIYQTWWNGRNDATTWSLAVLGVAIGDTFTNYLMYYLLDFCAQGWVDRLRKQALRRVLDQPRAWFEDEGNTAVEITTCLHESGEGVRNIVARFSAFVLIALTVTLMTIVWSLALCWKLTLVALSCGPVIYAITREFEATGGIWDRRCTAARASVLEVFLETFAEIRTLRTLTLERYFHLKHVKAVAQCLRLGLRKAIYTGALFGLVESTNVLVARELPYSSITRASSITQTALIFYYGVTLVRANEFTVDQVTSTNAVLLFSIAYAVTVMTWIPQISISREMSRRLFRLIDLPTTSHEHIGTVQPTKAAPITLNDLTFRYPSRDAPVLCNISFTIRPGSCTAVVGRSGSGKSTIASLLHPRPAITIAGIDIRALHTPTLRSLISIVPQQPTIFPGTIQENINYGLDPYSPLSTLFNVRAAAVAAGIDDFISSLPKGYQTVIGDGGIGLSGGQAQRIVIARALVRRPQVLVLDEATSALDPNSAMIIKQTIKRLLAERSGLTVVIITHARDMMEVADDVVVLEDGLYRVLCRKSHGKLRALIEHPEDGADN